MKQNILIADDDPVFRDVMATFYREYDFNVSTANDAMQACMQALHAPHPALIVLDIRMPAGSGMAVLRRLRMSNKTKNIPIIAVSADASPTLPEEARKAGATEFVLKPVDLEKMRSLAFRLLGLEEMNPIAPNLVPAPVELRVR